MSYRTEPLETYIADAAAGQPTPGGGSASALSGAVGAAMACMAANFTVGKKKYKAVWPRVQELLTRCDQAREALLRAVDEDAAAYSHVSGAYALPKETAEEKAARHDAIQKALRIAMETPLTVFRSSAGALGVLDELADLANPNLVSDVGVAAALLLGALDGAQLNVEINLAFLEDEELVAATRAELERTGPPAHDAAGKVLDKVYDRIRQ